MNNYQTLLATLHKAIAAGEPVLEACITDTDGSSYRKSGARMLIDVRGNMTGLLTGGCLEGELIALAPELLASGSHRVLNYDMRTQDPQQCTIGPGCNGRVRVRLSCLSKENSYGYLNALSNHFPQPVKLLSAIDSSGDYLVKVAEAIYSQGENLPDAGEYLEQASTQPKLIEYGGRDFLLESIVPARQLTILGGSMDAIILAQLAQQQGFSVEIQDYRESYISKATQAGLRAGYPDPAKIQRSDAIVIMSHHFDYDAEFLRFAVDSNAAYIGVLGPKDRGQRLLQRADLISDQFSGRLFNPAGLDIGADTTEQITLSILAEMLATLHRASGLSLRQKNGPVHG